MNTATLLATRRLKQTSSMLQFAAVMMLAVTAVLCVSCKRSAAEQFSTFLERGKTFRANKQYDRAILEFKNAAQAMPKDAEPYYQLGLTYLARNDISTSYAMLSKAVELNPKHTAAQLQLASYQMLGSSHDSKLLDKAQDRIDKVLNTAPDDPAALQLRAIREYRLGHLDQAAQDLKRALEKSPKQLSAAISLANLKAMQNDVPGGEAVLRKLVQDSPQSAEAALALADFYLQNKRVPDAEVQVKRATELDPKNVSALMLLASLQMNAGQNNIAEQTYQRISALPDPALKPLHAVFQYQQGNREAAISELHDLLKRSPNDRNIRSLLVSALIDSRQPQEAERLLTEALKRNPKDVDALMQRGLYFMNTGKLRETEADLRAVLQFKPDSAEAHYGLAKVNGLRGSSLVQRQELTETLRLNPKMLAARIELSTLVLSEDPRAALRILNESPEYQKQLPEYLIAKNWALLNAKEYAEVDNSLASELSTARRPELLYQAAILRHTQKNYAAARPLLEEALQQNPEYMPALNLLAQTYAAQGNTSRALEVIHEYAEKKPKSPFLLSLVGIWEANAKHFGQAKQAFLEAVNSNPDYIPARLALADLETSTGDADAARRTLREILSRESNNLQVRVRLADLERTTGNQAAAVEYYRAIVLEQPRDAVTINKLAYTLASTNPDEALKYAESAVELTPGSAAAEDTLGWVHYRKGNYARALTYFKGAVAKEPTAVRKYHLALAYDKTGDQLRAQENLKAALQLNPKLEMPERLKN